MHKWLTTLPLVWEHDLTDWRVLEPLDSDFFQWKKLKNGNKVFWKQNTVLNKVNSNWSVVESSSLYFALLAGIWCIKKVMDKQLASSENIGFYSVLKVIRSSLK